ncbi:MAG: S-layer homology domain-containing protein [Firmicutes bacterium]|nr:S-layer homology domain-containing protein [Bacillota bacterium]
MKINRTALFLAIFFSLMVIMPFPASASINVIIVNNFENDTIGEFAEFFGSNGGVVNERRNAEIRVDSLLNGEQVLKLHFEKNSKESNVSAISIDMTGLSKMTVVSFDMMPCFDEKAVSDTFVYSLRDAVTGRASRLALLKNDNSVESGGASIPSAFKSAQWNKVDMIFDSKSKTFDVYFNKKALTINQPIDKEIDLRKVGIMFGADLKNAATAYLDNFIVYKTDSFDAELAFDEILALANTSVKASNVTNPDMLVWTEKTPDDVVEHWAEKTIMRLIGTGAVAGYHDNTFRPDAPVTVNEFIKMLVAGMKQSVNGPRDSWSDAYINKAIEMNMVKEGEFSDYYQEITRGEMTRIAVRALYGENIAPEGLQTKQQIKIADFLSIDEQFKPYIAIATKDGIVTGDQNGNFNADNNATRAEASIIIERLLNFDFLSKAKHTISNGMMTISINMDNAELYVVTPKRVWKKALLVTGYGYSRLEVTGPLSMTGTVTREGADILKMDISLKSDAQEFDYTLTPVATGINNYVRFPGPYIGENGDTLTIPYRDGVGIPVGDTYMWHDKINTNYYVFYAGHNINQPWMGLTDGESSVLEIVETPFDAGIQIARTNGVLTAEGVWEHSRGDFTYARKVKHIFQNEGGYVGVCQKYREYAEETGLIVTLKDKAEKNSNVDMIVGAPAFYWQDNNPEPSRALSIAQTLLDSGLEKCIFYGGSARYSKMSAEEIEIVKKMGYATSRYSIFQDFVAPGDEHKLAAGMNPNHFPVILEDGILRANGERATLFAAPMVGGGNYYHYCLCESLQLKYAKGVVTPDQNQKNYPVRFLDVTAAQALMECYDPNHPMTRTDNKNYRVELLKWHRDLGIAIGSEGGWSCFVPYVDYFEGLRSTVPLNTAETPETNIFNMYEAGVLADAEKAELLSASKYILPLWQLVFGDCVQTFPRWNFGTAKFFDNEWTETQELLCALMGQPAMVTVLPAFWDSNENNKKMIIDHMIRVYNSNKPVQYAHMIDHKFLTQDKLVHQTVFDNGIIIIANFGSTPYTAEDFSITVKARGHEIIEKGN